MTAPYPPYQTYPLIPVIEDSELIPVIAGGEIIPTIPDSDLVPSVDPYLSNPAPDVEVSPTGRQATVIAAAFLVVRGLVASELLQRHVDADLIAHPGAAASAAWAKHTGVWNRLVTPAFEQLYRRGSHENLTPEQVHTLAAAYAASLGENLSATSAEAITEGFQKQLDARWSENVAWQRTIAAYGLDRPRLLSWLGNVLRAPDKPGAVARGAVDQLLLARAQTIGENEAWRGYQTAKVLGWMWQASQGAPVGTDKAWRTARDERTCPVCAELDGQTVPFAEPFRYGDGTVIFAPPSHPRCRCEVDLALSGPADYGLAKADTLTDWQAREHPRGSAGRFVAVLDRPAPATAPVTAPVTVPVTAPAAPLLGAPLLATPLLGAGLLQEQKLGQQQSLLAAPVLGRGVTLGTDMATLLGGKQGQKKKQKQDQTQHYLFLIPRRNPGARGYAIDVVQAARHLDPSAYSDEPSMLPHGQDGWEAHRPEMVGDTVDFDMLNTRASLFAAARADPDHPRAIWAAELGADGVHGAQIPAAEDEDHSFWAARPQLQKMVRDEAGAHYAVILAAHPKSRAGLSEDDLDEILALSGVNLEHPLHQYSETDKRHIITVALDKANGRRPPEDYSHGLAEADDLSLDAAFADYVTWRRPEAAGPVGRQLAAQMRVTHYGNREDFPHRDVYVFEDGVNFDPSLQPGHGATVPLVGDYHVDRIKYEGKPPGDPQYTPGVFGVRYFYLAPGRYPGPTPGP